MRVRTKPRSDMGISPYELMFGLPFLTTSHCMGTYEEEEKGVKIYLKTIAKH